MVTGTSFVDITLERPDTKIIDLIQFLWKEEPYAKAWQHREDRIAGHGKREINSTICKDSEYGLHIQNPLDVACGQRKCCVDLYAVSMLIHPYIRLIASRHGSVKLSRPPFVFDDAVVICRSTPDVILHRTVKE